MTISGDYSRLKTAADYYSGLDWKLLPVHGIGVDDYCTCGRKHTDPKDVGKHPAISEWQTSATSDSFQIQSWWDTDPRYNIAVMCRMSGFFVIDVDPRSGGFDSLDLFESRYPDALMPTTEAMTGVYQLNGKPVRGRHLFYKIDGNETLIGKLETLAKDMPGVDIKHNGYVLLAPSNHFSGVQYEWRPGHEPWTMKMAPANDSLLEALRKRGGRKNGSAPGAKWDWVGDLEWGEGKLDVNRFMDEGINEGSRAVDIYAMACALANKFGTDQIGREAVMSTMQKFNAEKVTPPLEWEGPNSLTMHVERAIEFIAANPKDTGGGSMGPGYKTYVQAQKDKPAATAIPTFARGGGGDSYTNTSDPDDSDTLKYVGLDVPGTIGGEISEIALNGGSVMDHALNVPPDPDALSIEAGGDASKRSMTDLGNGRRFVDSFGSVIRYTSGLGWFNWMSGFWRQDAENLGTREHAKRLSAFIAKEAIQYEDPDSEKRVLKWAEMTKANARQNSAIESATSDPRIRVAIEDWDSDSHLFGCLNGVIDLSTGELLKGRPDLYITRRAPVKYTPGLVNNRWMQFLEFATNGDKEYQDWLQKAVGYTLTGLRTHDVMFLMYGPGGTGKNVFTEAIVKLMGTNEYAWPLASEILADGDGKANAADLYHWAELRGRRMVWVDELPESDRLKENSVKKLTGSTEVSARSPGERPITFVSRAKLWVTTNHRPVITDDAMWRRLRPIPWMNIPETPDPGLKAYIFDPEGGLPGVLAWAVEGAMRVLNSAETDSLGWCKVVYEAAEMYRKDEDRIGRFLEEETVEADGEKIPMSLLFPTYENWSRGRNERPVAQTKFSRKLIDRSYTIAGDGRDEALMGRSLAAPASLAPEFDWDNLSRMHNR